MKALTHVIPSYITIGEDKIPRLTSLTVSGDPNLNYEQYEQVIRNESFSGLKLKTRKQLNVLVFSESLNHEFWIPAISWIDWQLQIEEIHQNTEFVFVYDIKETKLKLMLAQQANNCAVTETYLRMTPGYASMFNWHTQPIGTEAVSLKTNTRHVLSKVNDLVLSFQEGTSYPRIMNIDFSEGIADILRLQPVIPLNERLAIQDLDWQKYHEIISSWYHRDRRRLSLNRRLELPRIPITTNPEQTKLGCISRDILDHFQAPDPAMYREQRDVDSSTDFVHVDLFLKQHVLTRFSTPIDMRATSPITSSDRFRIATLPETLDENFKLTYKACRTVVVKVEYENGISYWQYRIDSLTSRRGKAAPEFNKIKLEGTPGDTQASVWGIIVDLVAKRLKTNISELYFMGQLGHIQSRADEFDTSRFECRCLMLKEGVMPYFS